MYDLSISIVTLVRSPSTQREGEAGINRNTGVTGSLALLSTHFKVAKN